jgi:hypothetical protein
MGLNVILGCDMVRVKRVGSGVYLLQIGRVISTGRSKNTTNWQLALLQIAAILCALKM